LEKKISIIVAVALNTAIGKYNKLLWHISEDLKRFKKLTTGNIVLLGKNTFYSLPVRPLPGRTNIVLSDKAGEQIEGCEMAYSIDEAISKCDDQKENFIIGGASIYRQFIPLAGKIYLTKVYKDFEGDCFFDEINPEEWILAEKEDRIHDQQNDFTYSYLIYERNRKKNRGNY